MKGDNNLGKRSSEIEKRSYQDQDPKEARRI